MTKRWTDDDFTQLFTLNPSEHAFVSRCARHNWLGVAVGLKWLYATGRFPATHDQVPGDVVSAIAQQLGSKATHYSKYRWTGRSAERHRTAVRAFVEIRAFRRIDIEPLHRWLVEQVLPSETSLVRAADRSVDWSREFGVGLPAPTHLERIVRGAQAVFAEGLFTELCKQLDPQVRARLDQLISTDPGNISERSRLSALKKPAGSVGVESLRRELDRSAELQAVGLPADFTDTVDPRLVELYAQRAATARPSELREHAPHVRHAMLALLVAYLNAQAIDTAVDHLVQLIHRIKTRAERTVTKRLIKNLPRITGKLSILCGIAEASAESPDEIVREVVYPIADASLLRDLVTELSWTGPKYKVIIRETMQSSYSRRYRGVIRRALASLGLRSNNTGHRPVLEAIAIVLDHSRSRAPIFPDGVRVPLKRIVPDAMLGYVTDDAGNVLREPYELFVLQAVRRAMRCKEIWADGSIRYGNPDRDVPADFEAERQSYYAALGAEQDPETFVSALRGELEAALDALEATSFDQSRVSLRDDGTWHVRRQKPLPEPIGLAKVKLAIIERWGTVSLLDILKEVDLRLDFTRHFETAASRQALPDDTLRRRLLLCLYALGTNLGLGRVAAAQGLETADALRYVRRRFIDVASLRRANLELVNGIIRIRNTAWWGQATACASDSRRFEAWDRNLMTEWHARYGGPGVMVYWHVERNAMCVYSQLRRCSSSEAAAMIEGVLKHCAEMEVERQYVDTHGQTLVAFGFSRLLKFDLMPRFKNLPTQRLVAPAKGAKDRWPTIAPAISGSVKWDRIHEQYDEMVKFTSALRWGTTHADAVLRRFTKDNIKHPTYLALRELGRVQKSLFLCRYLANPPLRRQVHESLNVVENWNSANDFIRFGQAGKVTTNDRNEQELGFLALQLVQNSLVFVNTLMLQEVLQDDDLAITLTDRDRDALTPLFYTHVNPYGRFELDMDSRIPIH